MPHLVGFLPSPISYTDPQIQNLHPVWEQKGCFAVMPLRPV